MHWSLQDTTTHHKHQLKLVVQFILEREGFMGEGVVAAPFLEREDVSEVRLFPRKPSLGPLNDHLWERTEHSSQCQTCPRTRGCWGTACDIPPGRKGGTVGWGCGGE